MTLTFVHGMKASESQFYTAPIAEIEKHITNYTDLYEITFLHGSAIGRAHVDIDGKMGDCTEDTFTMTHQMLLMALSSIDAGTPFALMTSSKFQNVNGSTGAVENKLSYSMVFTKKCGTNRAVADWTRQYIAPLIREATQMILPFHLPGEGEKPTTDYIDYDPSVYSKNRKMRVVGSMKPNEARPKVIYSEHTAMDTLISFIPDGCERLPEPKNETILPETPPNHTPISHEVLHRLVMSLKTSRADDRKDWLYVGIALHHSGAPLEIWEEFSKQSPKYRWGECGRVWAGFKQGALTERTLWRMLKEDNPAVFAELRDKGLSRYELFEVGATHFTFAQYFVNCMPKAYLYDGASGWWYVKENNTWMNSGQKFPPTLAITISRTLWAEMEEWRAAVLPTKTEETRMNFLKKVIKCQQSILQSGFLDATMKMCQGFYAEQATIACEMAGKPTISEMMDSNPMLFAFDNGVHDFSMINGVAVGKRDILPTDYISLTTGYHYPTKDTTVMKKVEETLQSIWARQGEHGDDGETYEYVMKMLAATLCGTRWMEAFYILTGSGRNGKGLLFELLQAVMGGYYYQLPTQILTTKVEKQGGARPDIVNLRGRRVACASEPEANEKLQEGAIKYMTGGDKLSGRALYGSEIQYKPQFGLFLQCNNIPTFNGITAAGVMRNRVIPFPFSFVAEPATPLQKRGDATIKNVSCKSEEWRSAMFYLLLQRFESIRGKSLDAVPMPRLVQERTEEYVAENNAIGTWWTENYEEAEGEYVLSKEAFMMFKNETGSPLNDKQFKAGLEFNMVTIKRITKRGDYHGQMGIVGWRVKEKNLIKMPEPGSDHEE